MGQPRHIDVTPSLASERVEFLMELPDVIGGCVSHMSSSSGMTTTERHWLRAIRDTCATALEIDLERKALEGEYVES